ncbi:MAG TPA: hypothetical protein VGR69_06820, partial [Candidatus Rubrimentiphilum sp.]|nr:hypothetical protein [Candidatus Rubrimentiphilum sp.]
TIEKRGVRLGKGARELAALLDRGVSRQGFYLADSFDATLAQARHELRSRDAEYVKLRDALAQRVAKKFGREIESDEFIVPRARYTKTQGVGVIDEQPTYLLCTLELDEPASDALKKREAAARAVAEAEDRVRAAITDTIANRRPELRLLAEAAPQTSKVSQWIR